VNPASRALPVLPPPAELVFAVLLVWLALAGMTLAEGQIGISWDALNHQVYLGWSADAPRFDRDVMPAAFQTYQFPYPYWPLYKLATGGATGVQAALMLATLQVATVPAIWIVARSCIPEASWFGTGMRLLAVGLAFLSGLVISLFTTTANDLLAAMPLLWAFAIVFPYAAQAAPASVPRWLFALSGVLGGVSVAFKLSNGPLVLVLPFLWLLVRQPLRRRAEGVILGCVTILLGFLLTYGSWGWQLWQLHGNPIYPFADHWFGLLRAAVGWTP
jgi:hypothetical protein